MSGRHRRACVCSGKGGLPAQGTDGSCWFAAVHVVGGMGNLGNRTNPPDSPTHPNQKAFLRGKVRFVNGGHVGDCRQVGASGPPPLPLGVLGDPKQPWVSSREGCCDMGPCSFMMPYLTYPPPSAVVKQFPGPYCHTFDLQEFGLTDLEAGVMYGAYGMLTSLYGFVMGFAVDNLGVKMSLVVGSILQLGSRLLLTFSGSRFVVKAIIYTLLPMGSALQVCLITCPTPPHWAPVAETLASHPPAPALRGHRAVLPSPHHEGSQGEGQPERRAYHCRWCSSLQGRFCGGSVPGRSGR